MFWFNPFDRREKFFVLLVTPDKISAVLFAVSRDRVISCEKFWSEFEINKPTQWWPKILSRWTVIVAASPSLAYTASIPLRLNRDEDNYQRPLSFPELENLLGRKMNQEFIDHRKEAADSLKTSDLDIVLADSRIMDFKIDGHPVYAPIGFTPHHIDAVVEMTFVHRNFYNLIRPSIRRSRFFFTSLARAKLTILKKVYESPFALLVLETPRSAIFQLTDSAGGEHIERREIAWSAKGFLQVCMDVWGVNEETARDIYHLYEAGKLPLDAQQLLEKEFKHVMHNLDQALHHIPHKSNILVTNQEEMLITSPTFTLQKISLDRVLERMGFTLKAERWPVAEHEQFSYCAPLLEFFSDQGNPDMNRWLRRRLHWLGSMNYN